MINQICFFALCSLFPPLLIQDLRKKKKTNIQFKAILASIKGRNIQYFILCIIKEHGPRWHQSALWLQQMGSLLHNKCLTFTLFYFMVILNSIVINDIVTHHIQGICRPINLTLLHYYTLRLSHSYTFNKFTLITLTLVHSYPLTLLHFYILGTSWALIFTICLLKL